MSFVLSLEVLLLILLLLLSFLLLFSLFPSGVGVGVFPSGVGTFEIKLIFEAKLDVSFDIFGLIFVVVIFDWEIFEISLFFDPSPNKKSLSPLNSSTSSTFSSSEYSFLCSTPYLLSSSSSWAVFFPLFVLSENSIIN